MTALLHTFTAFCRDDSGEGTTWIDTVEATGIDHALTVATTKCAEAWGRDDPATIMCIGLAEGSVSIAYWADDV